jgi:hypothetical protein
MNMLNLSKTVVRNLNLALLAFLGFVAGIGATTIERQGDSFFAWAVLITALVSIAGVVQQTLRAWSQLIDRKNEIISVLVDFAAKIDTLAGATAKNVGNGSPAKLSLLGTIALMAADAAAIRFKLSDTLIRGGATNAKDRQELKQTMVRAVHDLEGHMEIIRREVVASGDPELQGTLQLLDASLDAIKKSRDSASKQQS